MKLLKNCILLSLTGGTSSKSSRNDQPDPLPPCDQLSDEPIEFLKQWNQLIQPFYSRGSI